MPKPKSGKKQRNRESVRGVLQSEIDKLRGTRGHGKAMSGEDIQKDYKRVGIDISKAEADEIFGAVFDFSGGDYYFMREAAQKEMQGKKLSQSEKKSLKRYKKIMEYTKIAPTYKGEEEFIYRGIKNSGSAYSQKVLALKPGQKFDFDKMPTSFTTNMKNAESFANQKGYTKGIIFKLPANKLKNSVSIRGYAKYFGEDEVLLGDYDFKVKSNKFSKELDKYIIELK